MKSLLSAWIVAAACLGGCAVTQPPAKHSTPALRTEPTTGRSYYIMVPHSYRRGKPAPVIISCHGTIPFDTSVMHSGEWEWLAEQHGCILVTPSMIGTDGILGAGPSGRMLADEKLILSILGHLNYLYDIDRNNIMITGFSGGGFPAYFVGLRHPDVFSVVAARNCNFNERSIDGWYPPEALNTPVLVYYSEHDPGAIRGQSRNAVAYFKRKGFKLATALVPDKGHERTPEYAMKFFVENWQGTPPPFRPLPKSALPLRFRFHRTWR